MQLVGSNERAKDSMFETHFQLQRRPFPSVPSPDRYFAASTIENARLSLVRLVERDEGPGLVIGAAGTGKTMLCHAVEEAVRDQCRVVRLHSGRLRERRALLQSILYALGLPYRDLDEGELRLALIDHVTDQTACPGGILILVDESESLALSLMEELRTMTNLTSAGQACVKLILLGNQRLEEKFADPRMESFAQRIAGRFYLEPYNRDESRRYIEHQILKSGGNLQMVMTDDAIEKIYQATEGVPRLINQLCDHAMILCTINDVNRMTEVDVETAWTDLQQLPIPRTEFQESPSIVEFGQLDSESIVESVEATIETIEQELPTETPAEPPEVELILHDDRIHDPFSESFDEEIVVIDKYATPDDLSNRQQRQVICEDSHMIASQLDDVLQQIRQATKPTPAGEVLEPAVVSPVEEEPEPNIVTFTAQDAEITKPEDAAEVKVEEPADAVVETVEVQPEVASESPVEDIDDVVDEPVAEPETVETAVKTAEESMVGAAASTTHRAEPLVREATSTDDEDAVQKLDTKVEETQSPEPSSPKKKTYRNLFTRLQKRD